MDFGLLNRKKLETPRWSLYLSLSACCREIKYHNSFELIILIQYTSHNCLARISNGRH